ncbi:MAG: trypsin-like peptidase domain-containing protein [Clostridia bacterium]|nr:trypsin-like peptidase domain-containing protein [Clostridia bacterium]
MRRLLPRVPARAVFLAVAIVAGAAAGAAAGTAAARITVAPLIHVSPVVRAGRAVPVSPAPAPPAPAVAVAERVGPGIVGIINQERLRDWWTGFRFVPRGAGSGVVIDPRGYIVTNYHVVEGASRLLVVLADGTRLEGAIVGVDPPTDLAVVRVRPPQPLTPAPLGDSDRVRVGETAIAIGNPLGLEFERSVTQGVISGRRALLYGQAGDRQFQRVFELLQTDAAINPGNSGGALVDAAGRVIGVNTFKLVQEAGVEGMGFAIPANTVRRVAAELMTHGRVRRAWLGVEVAGPETAAAAADGGLVITRVAPGSPAVRAGIRVGDILAAVDEVATVHLVDLVRVLETRRPGQQVTLVLRREGRRQTVRVTLGEVPA